MKEYLFTSEAVTEGHPDKVCDIISDTILDEALKQDKESKVAIETTIKDDFIFIYGEISSNAKIDFESIAKRTIKEIGYNENYEVFCKVSEQSEEINKAVNGGENQGAGDQGIMFGYACDETESLMPAAIYYANLLAKKLSMVSKRTNFLNPDGKTQVTAKYVNDVFVGITDIVVSAQHTVEINQETLRHFIIENVIKTTIPSNYITSETNYIVNPIGSFIKGGSFGDSGTTGRKIVCDTYGGYGRVGGGCLSSKDPSKVDRSAAYYCRYVAKSIVANGLARKCEIGVSYAIGQSKPISIYFNSFNTHTISEEQILDVIKNNFDFSVSNIINELKLKNPIYKETACYGHFGREFFPWEKIKKLR